MGVFQDLSGQKFGHLLVLNRADDYVYKSGRREVLWNCQCDCGNIIKVRSCGLKNGHHVSCGCQKKNRLTTHGLSDTRIDIIFRGMKQRCYDTNAENYSNYGGRGIKICSEWLNNKRAFFDWSFQNGYSDDKSIDRIDVNGNYTPDNCRWVDNKTQSNNRRNNRILTYKGISKDVQEWAEATGIPYQTIYSRINMGWSTDRVLTEYNNAISNH